MNRGRELTILGTALLLILGGCSRKSENARETGGMRASTASSAPVDMATAGNVSGKVTLEGTVPVMRPINMSAEPYCESKHPTPVLSQDVVVGPGGALANVVVYVKDGLGDRTFPVPGNSVKLDQQGCLYEPHVVALMAGQNLEIVNDDQTTHNVHVIPTNNPAWNKSQPSGAAPILETFAHGELGIPVECNVHPWMKSYIAVFKQPYFAVTGPDGSFDLKNLPPGTYTIAAWQEKYGTVDQQVTVGPKESKTVDLTFKTSSASGD